MRFLLDLLFPPKCMLCHKIISGKEALCDACARKVLAQSTNTLRGHHFSRCVAPLTYDGDVRKSIHRYKFGGNAFYAETYAMLMAACVRRELHGEFDLITFVPISRRRKRKRGYDQSKLLAEHVSMALRKPMVAALVKVKDMPAQSSLLDADQRRKNVAGVYQALAEEQYAGKRVLLVDDIVTTGATLEECSKMLVKAGAANVVCVTLAMTK